MTFCNLIRNLLTCPHFRSNVHLKVIHREFKIFAIYFFNYFQHIFHNYFFFHNFLLLHSLNFPLALLFLVHLSHVDDGLLINFNASQKVCFSAVVSMKIRKRVEMGKL